MKKYDYTACNDTVRKPTVVYRAQRDRELAHRYPQILSRKERTDTKRQQPSRAAGIAQQNSGTCSTLGHKWSAFKRSLDVKVRIVMYRVAPFFTLREYYLSPWYERSRRKAEEASWTVAWQQMNQPAALQGAKSISACDTTPFLTPYLSLHFPLCQQGHVIDRQVHREQLRSRRHEGLTIDDDAKSTGISTSIQDVGIQDVGEPNVFSSIVGLGSLLGWSSVSKNTGANARTTSGGGGGGGGGSIDNRSMHSGNDSSDVGGQVSMNNEIGLDVSSSLLRVRSQQGLIRSAIFTHS